MRWVACYHRQLSSGGKKDSRCRRPRYCGPNWVTLYTTRCSRLIRPACNSSTHKVLKTLSRGRRRADYRATRPSGHCLSSSCGTELSLDNPGPLRPMRHVWWGDKVEIVVVWCSSCKVITV